MFSKSKLIHLILELYYSSDIFCWYNFIKVITEEMRRLWRNYDSDDVTVLRKTNDEHLTLIILDLFPVWLFKVKASDMPRHSVQQQRKQES